MDEWTDGRLSADGRAPKVSKARQPGGRSKTSFVFENELMNKLIQSASANGRGISSEVAYRLERSFAAEIGTAAVIAKQAQTLAQSFEFGVYKAAQEKRIPTDRIPTDSEAIFGGILEMLKAAWAGRSLAQLRFEIESVLPQFVEEEVGRWTRK